MTEKPAHKTEITLLVPTDVFEGRVMRLADRVSKLEGQGLVGPREVLLRAMFIGLDVAEAQVEAMEKKQRRVLLPDEVKPTHIVAP